MELDVILFGLRILSTMLLLVILGAFFRVLWLEYRATSLQLQSPARSYGQLVTLLQVDGHYQETKTVHTLRPLTSIGRAPTSAIVIQDTFASSDHAVVILKSGQWWLEDRNSRNGTLLNDEPVGDPVIITDGDIIGIGNTRFRLRLNA